MTQTNVEEVEVQEIKMPINQPAQGSTEADKGFTDANSMDKKIPKNLLMKYQGNWYILKAGLEYKATVLYGGGNYGVTTEIVERQQDYALAKATFKTKEGIEFSNYGEASHANVTNPQMRKYLLHLAITRAECRVLRMATACGYTSMDEMDMESENARLVPQGDHDGEAATETQKKMITGMGGKITDDMTQAEAKQLIVELVKKGI